MKQIRKIAILIPAHNEETVIEETINSFLALVAPKDIFIVNDGSKDSTEAIAKRLVPNVLTLNPNQGKAQAMNSAIKHFKLTEKYDYILPMDADTQITSQFIKSIMSIFDADKKEEITCVVGKVVGRTHSWLTTYRMWEYEVAQTIHKAAQANINAVIVCPGCATVYRSKIFKKVKIPTGTLTEDMDFTFLIHRQNLGKIVYTDKAIVVTQDPDNIKDFIKQIDRWYTGFWQCIVKHNVPWGGQTLDAELSLLSIEGLFNGLLALSLLMLVPMTVVTNVKVLLIPLALDLLFFLIPTIILTIKRHRVWKIFFYLPQFYFLRVLSCLIFLRSFIKVVCEFDVKMEWNKPTRYSVRKEEEWLLYPQASTATQ